jgi:hypothetical protein
MKIKEKNSAISPVVLPIIISYTQKEKRKYRPEDGTQRKNVKNVEASHPKVGPTVLTYVGNTTQG